MRQLPELLPRAGLECGEEGVGAQAALVFGLVELYSEDRAVTSKAK